MNQSPSYNPPIMVNRHQQNSSSLPSTPQPTAQIPDPTYQERLRKHWANITQGADNLANKAYSGSRNMYGNANLVNHTSRTFADALEAGGNTLGHELKPTNWAGAANIGMAGLGAAMNFSDSVNRGMDVDDSLGQSLGLGLGSYGGGAGGAALGSMASPFLATLGPIGMVAAAAAPFIGQAIGTGLGGAFGKGVGGAAVDLFDHDNDYSNQNQANQDVRSLGKYAQFLNDGDKTALANFLALNDAQQGIAHADAKFSQDLARENFDHAARVNFQDKAAMSSLEGRIAMAQDDQRSRYEMANNNTNNLWSGINNNMQSMSAMYGR